MYSSFQTCGTCSNTGAYRTQELLWERRYRIAKLCSYDGRGTEAIEERLWMESARIDVDQGRLVLAIRALVVRQAV